jgi:hypothetical protein
VPSLADKTKALLSSRKAQLMSLNDIPITVSPANTFSQFAKISCYGSNHSIACWQFIQEALIGSQGSFLENKR